MLQKPDLEKQKQSLSGRIPFVIGVTGHRDLRADDEPALRREVAAVIDQLKHDYLRDDPNTPIVILSALAEGADSLVAEVALEHGAILIAPLPMEEAEYREDFKPGNALRPGAENKFTGLLGCAIAKIEMPYRNGSRETVKSDPDKRADQYQDVGLYIVNNCHVLLALWNGAPGEKGGTSQMVDFKRGGIPYELLEAAHVVLDGCEIGPVIEIVTPRNTADAPSAAIRTKPWGFRLTNESPRGLRRFVPGTADLIKALFGGDSRTHHSDPESTTWRIFRVLCAQTRRFNGDAAAREASPDGQRDLARSLAALFTDYADAGRDTWRAEGGAMELPRKTFPVRYKSTQQNAPLTAVRWCDIYQRADALALNWQAQSNNDRTKIFLAAFTTIVIFETYAHLQPHPLLLILYCILLTYSFFLAFRSQVQRRQERFFDYRSLAEVARVAVYWRLAGIRNRVASVYPINQGSETSWTKIVIRTLDLLEGAMDPIPVTVDRLMLDDVRKLWVVGQSAYFTAKSRQLSLSADQREVWSLFALGLAPLVGAIGLGSSVFMDAYTWEHEREYMVVAMALLVGLAAVIAGYNEQSAFKEMGRRYSRMLALFERALRLINRALNAHPSAIAPAEVNQIQNLYIELGTEAMRENADWASTYRQRPIRPAG